MTQEKIEGAEALERFWPELIKNMRPLATAWLKLIEGRMKVYPPPVGNPEKPHYERGIGMVWPVKHDEVSPESAAKGVELIRPGWHGVRTSERLGAAWAMDETRQDSIILGNKASYSPEVQSSEKQESDFQGRWTTDEMAYEATLPDFERMCIVQSERAAQRAGAINIG